MLKFSSSLFILLFCCNIFSQSKEKDTTKVAPRIERYGLRLGVDLSKIARSFYEKDYKGLEIVGDYRLSKKMYIAAELGNENKTVDDSRVNFTTRGSFLKVGFDFNGYENWLDMENMIHIGMRYGASTFSQELNSYKIYDTSRYFPTADAVNSDAKYNGLSAQWAEVVAGAKAELFNNFYIGFSVRMNYLFSNKKPDNFDNLFIPGYNRTYDGKFGAGFNYTLSYFIPLYKKIEKKNKPKKNTDAKKKAEDVKK
jgi:hypothetical protein